MRKYFDSVLSATGEGVNGAVITLKDQNNATAQLYSDNGSTPLSSCTSDANGYFEFYVANGRYQITITYQGVVAKQINDVLLVDSYANGWISAGQLQVEPTGSNGQPQLASMGDTDTGLRWAGSDTLRFVIGGVEAARFDALGALLLGAGGAADATPELSSFADTNTGIRFPGSDVITFVTGGSEQLRVTSDGRFYGMSLHNNAGAVTGTTNQYVASGTYTPTLTNVTNVAASSASIMQWMRVGNVVTVSGQIQIDPTATGALELGVSLPIASTFGTATRLSGTAVATASTEAFALRADTTNNRAAMVGLAVDTANHNVYSTFTYVVL